MGSHQVPFYPIRRAHRKCSAPTGRLTATPAGTNGNNGDISQTTDNITGEQVSYTYDQLNRLVQSASNVTGTMPFAYDGFGNLTQTPGPATYSYDVANRMVSNGAIYNPRNQRVFDGTYIYLYTPDGKLAGKYAPAWSYAGSQAFIQGQPNMYFAGMLIQEQGHWVMTDRLGSVRLDVSSGARSSYQPYGAEVAPATSDQRTKFATYYRDSAGLDYAGQRYYSNVAGRFLTPDPAGFSAANPNNPATWNSYAYVHGDPVNFNDSTGDGECAVGEPVPCTETVNGDAPNPTDWSLYAWNPTASLISPAWTAMNYDDVHGIPVPVAAVPVMKDLGTSNLARSELRSRLANFSGSNCDKVFGSAIAGYTTAGFLSDVNSTNFYNVQNEPYASLTQNQVVGNGDKTQLINSVPYGNPAGTILGSSGAAVLLGPNCFLDTVAGQQNTLVHELLHVYTNGWSDTDIFTDFKRDGLTQINPGSGDITAWISTDCTSTPPGVR